MKSFLKYFQNGKRYGEMIEYLKHLLGICGEPHGLIYTIFSFGGISAFLTYLKFRSKNNA
tara:strand:- start:250 stop:429 length:180 start_codon:yes stop_codon:yes gene_type:complete